MSLENLGKELDAINEKIRTESDIDAQLALMAERDQLMHQVVTAHHEQAAYHQKQVADIEDKARAKTVQMPYSFK